MSIFGALNSSVTGLKAQSDALGVISDNISNVNTTGYKANKASFSNLVTAAATQTSYNPGGVQLRPGQEVQQQGILNSTDVTTDLAIEGNGMFAVKDAAGEVEANELKYTRTGNFRVDENGDLKNANGFLLQGWRLNQDDNGNLTPPSDMTNPGSLETVNVKGFSGIARATENVNVGANLPPNLPVDESRSTTVRIFDSEGTAHNLKLEFTRNDGAGNELGANQYRVDIHAPTRSEDNTNPQGALFDLGATATGVVDITDGNNKSGFQEKIADTFTGEDPTAAGGGTRTVTKSIDGVNFAVPNAVDNNGNNSLERDELLGNTAADNQITLDPGGAGVNITDLSTKGLIQATISNAGGAVPASAIQNNGDTVDVNILGTNTRVRLQTQDGSRIDGGTPLAAADVDNATVIQFDDNGDGNFDAGTDTKLVDSDNTSTNTFDKASRLSTVVQFNGDGSIETIGNNVNNNLATDFLPDGTSIVSGNQGELSLNLDFAQQQNSVPGGTDANEPQEITLNLGTPRNPDGNPPDENEKKLDGLTSFENPEGFRINELEQDGLQFGEFTGVSVDEEGIVTAEFSNGERREVFQVPVATFNNPNGLQSQSGTVFRETPESGEVLLNKAGIGGAGTFSPSTLEDSTVDLAGEFTKMIETQRAYSASTRVVTTSDEMLQTITNATR